MANHIEFSLSGFGFREDTFRGWKGFLAEEEARLREDASAIESLDMTPVGRAVRFLNESLQYPKSSFDAVLLWDLLDYLEPTLAKQTVASLTELLRPAGVVFAMFHSKSRKDFNATRSVRTRCKDFMVICPAQKVYQNRSQDLFGRYRTVKSFVSRDQLRETLFIKVISQTDLPESQSVDMFTCLRLRVNLRECERFVTHRAPEDHDSTGLRAAKLNTPLFGVPVKHTCFTRASGTTHKKARGNRGFPFFNLEIKRMFRRRVMVMAMLPAT
jgi:hypothetical protein